MKKSNPSNQSQRTLFQSWGKQSTSQSKTTRQETLQNSGFDPLEIIDLGDDDEDDGLLVAAMEMETIDSITNGNIAQASTSSHRNVNISIPGTSESSPKEIETLPGFDVEAGDIWIYPTNYPVRDYQFKIVEKALFVNTLVTLPTGLGKTFIAAVLMYNYYRWYPQGKVIFMAPTKPLVAQQIEACYNIMGIPESDTAQMTGNMAPSKREVMWKSKRVFFLTPQVLQNDLGRGSCDADQVVLLVFDEAHKSLGNHAYCQVIREVYSYTRNFRVLALSATPGDDIKSVQQVMTNLLISHMELRSEDSPDIQAYTHDRTVDKIVVALGEDIIRIKTQFLKVLEGIVGRLFCNRALWQKDPQRVTKFMLLSGRDQFRKRDAEGYTNSKKGAIEGDFAMGISLYHAYELLHQHGILSFYNFIKSIVDGSKGMARARTEIRRHCEFMEIMDELRQSIERPPDEMAETSALFSQFTSPRRKSMMREAFDPSFRSHPKLLKLEEVIVDHFQKFAENVSTSSKDDGDGAKAKPTDIATRVMIFSQYRDSVGEITAILNKHKPLVRVMSFIGQASTGKSSRGLSQKEQLEVVQKFRNGGYNTLVATCVGEEGLDIGDVDLIVCFDAHASPIRLVQRMGRTGRKRNGRIVVLVSEGKEEQVYKRSLSSKKSIHKAIVQGSKSFELYDDNPRMIPRHLTPRVHKMEMTVGKFVGNSKRKRKSGASEGNGNISNFMSKSTSSKSSSVAGKDDGLLTYEELIYWQENFKLPNCEAGITPSKKRRSRNSMSDPPVKEISLNEWMPWQNVPSPIHKIAHSRRTEHLIEILEFIELHSGEDDAYDVEMMSFLNEEDLVGVGDESGVDAPLIILDDEDSTVTLGDCNDRKKSVNQKKKKRNVSDENKAKDNRKTNSKKSMKTKKLSPQRKWKEYLKSFENEDNDFEPVEKESPIDDQEKNDETEKCCQPESTKEEKPTEKPDAIAVDADGSDNVPVETEIPEQEEEDDTLELSSQGFSQLLPSLTPHNTHVFRSKLLGMDNCVKDVPMPPSLDSLNEISPFTPTKSLEPFEQGNKRNANQDRIAVCRRNIQVSKTVIEEPPNLSEFDEGDAELMADNEEILGVQNKDLAQDFSVRDESRKSSIPDVPPSLLKFNESEDDTIKDDEKEKMGFESKDFGKKFPVRFKSRQCYDILDAPDSAQLDDREEDVHESKYTTPKKDTSSFGAGVICNSATKSFDDDIEIEFGDESLTDGLLTEFVDDDMTGDAAHSSNANFNMTCETEFSKEVTSRTSDSIARSSESESKNLHATGPPRSVKSSLKTSISKLSTFERNTKNVEVSHELSDLSKSNSSSTCSKEYSFLAKTKLGNKTQAESTRMNSSNEIPIRGDFEFKKPSISTVNCFSKSPGCSGLTSRVQRHHTGNDARSSRMATSSAGGKPTKLSLKRNTDQVLGKVGNSVGKVLCPNQEEKKQLLPAIASTTDERNAQSDTSVEDDQFTQVSLRKSVSQLEDSPVSTSQLIKPLRERIGLCGSHKSTFSVQKPVEIIQPNDGDPVDEDSPILRKRPKSRIIPTISSPISPLCHTPTPSSKGDAMDEESPLVRRRSKIKKKNGDVVAIAESDEEDEIDVNIPGEPTFGESAQPAKTERESKVSKNERERGRMALTSDSDEEFISENHKQGTTDDDKRIEVGKRKIQLHTSVKLRRLHSRIPSKKQRTHMKQFLDEEAELSGSDIEDFSDDESDCDDEFDSFIDDSSQLTQRTPTQTNPRKRKSHNEMFDVYRQSLISPLARDMNFKTPTMCRNRNRYKMKFKPGTGEESASEAEETYERESDLEDELEFDSEEECDLEECETEAVDDDDESDAGGSAVKRRATVKDSTPYGASQIRRPLKRVKRKRILNESMDEDPAPHPTKTPPFQSPQVPTLKARITHAFNNVPQNSSCISPKQTSFVKPSCLHVFTAESNALAKPPPTREGAEQNTTSIWNSNQRSSKSSSKDPNFSFKDSKAMANDSLSTTFEFDWGIDFSDLDLLDAMEDSNVNNASNKACPARNDNTRKSKEMFCDQEMQEIAFAMAATDDDFNMSEMPTFSLGLDLFGDFGGGDGNMDIDAQADTTTSANNYKDSTSLPKRQNTKSETKFTKIVSPRLSGGANNRELNLKRSTQSSDCSKSFSNAPQNNGLSTKTRIKEATPFCRPSDASVNVAQTDRLSSVERSFTSTASCRTNNTACVVSKTVTKKSFLQAGSRADGLKDITNRDVTPSSTPRSIPTAFVSPSQKDKGKLVILADTKEISICQVVSVLRRKHNIKAEVCQLTHCDYVVSNRMGVIRKLASAVANGANSTKLLNKMRILCDLYERPSFIIEKDRVKPGETERDYSRSNAYIYTLACMALTHIKVLFSESQEETASLLTDLADLEARKNANILCPLTMNKETQQVFRFLLTIPRVSYVTALNLCSSLRTLRDLLSSSPDDLQKMNRQLTEARATEICNYLKFNFHVDR